MTVPRLSPEAEARFASPPSPAAALPAAAGPSPSGRGRGLENHAEKPRPDGAIPQVIGLDPSLTAAGVASSQGWCKTVGYVKAKAKDPGITQLPHLQRYEAMTRLSWEIVDLIGQPDLVVVEAPAFTRSGGGAHERSYLWWSLFGAFKLRHIPVAVISIQQRLTYATGKGSGSKGVVVDAVARRWPMFATNGDDNLADAAVFCAAGMDWLGHPLAVVPAAHRAALSKVAWPEIGGAS